MKSEPHELVVKNINPYLVPAEDTLIFSRSRPICSVPEVGIGNKPIDGGFYLFTDEEKQQFLILEPKAVQYFRKWLGSDEFLNGYHRWCLWLGDCSPEELRSMPEVMKRVEAVRHIRLESKSAPTRKLADTPTRFHVENFPKGQYLLIPEVSSENRRYIPIGFFGPEVMASNLVKVIPNATLYHFGVLESLMHMTWVNYVCGRLESRYRYSKDIVYNNFPWPRDPSGERVKAVEEAAQAVLDTRARYPESSLADLYDPLSMPADLVRAHQTLDRAVDAAYGKRSLATSADRMNFLFDLYREYVGD